jgi:hypothetical protein
VVTPSERALDQILADSFPASDPPSWTSGITRPEWARPGPGVRSIGSQTLPRHRTFLRSVAALLEAAFIALIIPFAILLVGLPAALAARGVAEAIAWLASLLAG